ncbi:PigN-domain-containing protein [Obba rivulosa]|uniref:GPI ethanolamine phosphate transferase 1 n=1 Tax=Obba rivulosa TaxID=1052685 RepID=A0A8E2DMD1_9APHY|nr:PigN-domain-containing protein [Obba rivulosa]
MAATKKSSTSWLLLTGLVFHLVYIGTVFDCYFTSPVVHGMQSFGLDTAEARRLVLVVGDGLRADLLFALNAFSFIPSAPEVVAPHLRSVVESKGAFGVSHTHVPTESRPGHVALIGGMYEDVSAVTKGWKTNPVDFDSVFNRSSHTFSFGSPDILPMFGKGATPGKVDMWCYNEEEEDFTKDATALDVWVLQQLRALFHNATQDVELDHQLRQEKTVFFLHLLGLDTTGHSYRPHSKEYMMNIQVVDEIVRQTEELFAEYFRDEETAFVFTADHGMSRIGNHGDGDPDNTRTPLVMWGKGVRGPLPDSTPSSHDEYSQSWGLTQFLRRDVEQADIAALMATLIGVEWPVNSVGVLPDVDPTRPGYLDFKEGEATHARAALLNARVILEHYRVKHEEKGHSLFYEPYPPLADSDSNIPGNSEVLRIEQLIEQGHFHQARSKSVQLINIALEGLRYLQTYDRMLIRAIVSAAYLGWIAFGATSILLPQDELNFSGSLIIDLTSLSLLFVSWGLFALQRSPWTFYLYICFPMYFWQQALQRTLKGLRKYAKDGNMYLSTVLSVLLRGGLVVAALQCMVAGYTHRSIWSAGFVIMGTAWPLFFWPRDVWSRHSRLLLAWSSACLLTAIFPLLSVDKQESLPAILSGGVLMLGAGIAGVIFVPVLNDGEKKRFSMVIIVQCLLILASMIVTLSSALNLRAKLGLPLLNQVSGWIIFSVASIFPFTGYAHAVRNPLGRILAFFLAFSACFVILSISVEGLFYCAFSATLLLWIEVEAALRRTSTTENVPDMTAYRPQADDLRIAVFFLFFVQVAFFGTGNVASISSFYLEPVYRLVPVFNPFLMAVLLIFKIVAPYIILATSFYLLNARLHLPPMSLFLVALTLTDVMTVTFFFNVTDTGSWLEIGQTISFFCISSLLLVWTAGTVAIGEKLMADTLTSPVGKGKVQ